MSGSLLLPTMLLAFPKTWGHATTLDAIAPESDYKVFGGVCAISQMQM